MQSFKFHMVVIVAILLVIPVMVMVYDILFVSRTDDVLLVEMQGRLTKIVDIAGEQIVEQVNAELQQASDEDLTPALKEVFNGVTTPVVSNNPGVRMGMYIVASNNVIVQGFLHEYRVLSPKEKEQREKRIFQEAKAGINTVMAGGIPVNRVGQTWDDQFLEYLIPVRINDRLVAVVWAEQRMHPVFVQSARARLVVRYITLSVFSFAVLATVFTVSALVRRVGRIKDGLSKLKADLGNRIPEMPGELGQIAGAINDMAAGMAEKEHQLDQLRRSEHLAALGQLATEVAHELRNPVSIIQATVEVMEPLIKRVPDLEEYVMTIQEQVNRHNKLVAELLSFGHSGREQETLDLNNLIQTVMTYSEPLLHQRRINVEFLPAEGVSLIHGNKEKLQQVFLNLVLNAVQAMGSGGALTVKTFLSGEEVCALFHDTGEGIAPEDITRIFEPFYTRKTSGGGLGLAISQEIVRIHGGNIKVESELGRGTTFIVCFPLLKCR